MKTTSLIAASLVVISTAASAERSSVNSVSCTQDTLSLMISEGDPVQASSADVTAIQIKASGDGSFRALSNASSLSQGDGNNIIVSLGLADQFIGIPAGCEVRISNTFSSNLEPIERPVVSN